MMSEKSIVSLHDLEERADYFAGQSIAPATRRAYETDWKVFFEFCHDRELTPIPADPETVALFVTHSAQMGRCVSTIARRCTSIGVIHENAGHLSPIKDARVQRVFRGIRRTIGAPKRKSKALSWSDLIRLVSQCDCSMMGMRDAAILSLGWSVALRRSELVALNVGDLEFVDQGLVVTVKRSKTDQEGNGVSLAIPRSGGELCPVYRVQQWINRVSKNSLPSDTPLFPHIGRANSTKWYCTPGHRLADRMVSKIVKRYCQFAGLSPDQYSAHSLRRGLATEAGARGVPERIISRHTRHRSVDVLRGYIEDGGIWAENPLPAIYAGSRPSSGSHQNSEIIPLEDV